MISMNISYAKKYDYLSEKFQLAYQFLEREDLAELKPGVMVLAPGIEIRIQHYDTIPSEEGRFEAHRNHFDIQYVVEGIELMGVTDVKYLTANTEYDKSDDVTFYMEPDVSSGVVLKEKEYIILAPEDAHKPRCAAGKISFVKKIVVKIEV